MSFRTSVLLIVVGSVLAAASCFAIGALGAFPMIATTAYTLYGWVLGGTAVVGGFVTLMWLATRPAAPQPRPVRPAQERRPAPRTTTVRSASARGGRAAAARAIGGAAAASNHTEQLPAVGDDEPETVLIPSLAGRSGCSPLRSGRPAPVLRTVVAAPNTAPVRTVVAAADPSATVATTLKFPPVRISRAHLADAPHKRGRGGARGAAVPALNDSGVGTAQETWTAGGMATAGRYEINNY